MAIKHNDEIIQNHIEQLATINAILNIKFPIFEKKIGCIEEKIETLRREIKNGISDKLADFSNYIKDQKEKEESRYEMNDAGEKVLKERRIEPEPKPKKKRTIKQVWKELSGPVKFGIITFVLINLPLLYKYGEIIVNGFLDIIKQLVTT